MKADYPLRFEPIFRRALWGGRRLETVLGKSLPPGNDYAESWEIVDHGADQSCVTHGPLQGMALSVARARAGDRLCWAGTIPRTISRCCSSSSMCARTCRSRSIPTMSRPPGWTRPIAASRKPGLCCLPNRAAGSTPGSARASIAPRWNWPSHAGRPRAACIALNRRRGTASRSRPGRCMPWVPDCWSPKSNNRATRRFDCATGIASGLTDCPGHCMSGKPGGRGGLPRWSSPTSRTEADRSVPRESPDCRRQVRGGPLELLDAQTDRRRRPMPYCGARVRPAATGAGCCGMRRCGPGKQC